MPAVRHRRLVLSLALVFFATTASALQHTCSQSKALRLRGGSDEEGLFGEAPDDGDDDEETKASKRYAAAVAQLKKEGGACAALDEFEAESLKPDRDESKLAVLWMDVKLQNLQKKRPEDYKPGDAAHAYARGVAFLATECGAYVEAEKISVATHDGFCERCAAALDVEVKIFRETLAEFEASLGKQLHEGVAQRVKALRAALDDEGFAEKAFASLQKRESKILEMVSDVSKVEELRKDMLANLDQAAGDAVAEAAMCQQLLPAVEAMLGERLLGGGEGADASGDDG
jgi:hypothetical protein